MCSQAVCKGSFPLSTGSNHGGGEGGRWSFEGAGGHLGKIHRQVIRSYLWAGFLMVRPFDKFWVLVTVLPSSCNPSTMPITSVFWGGMKKSGPLGQGPTWPGTPGTPYPLTFPQRINYGLKGSLTALGSATLVKCEVSKVKFFFLWSLVNLVSDFMPQWWARTSPLHSQVPTKVFSSMRGCQNKCFMGGRGSW